MSKLFRKYPSHIRKNVGGIYIIDPIFIGYLMSEEVYDEYRIPLNQGKCLWEVLPPLPYKVCYFEAFMPCMLSEDQEYTKDMETEQKPIGMLWDYTNPEEAFHAICIEGVFSRACTNMLKPVGSEVQLAPIEVYDPKVQDFRLQFACHKMAELLNMAEIVEKESLGGEKKFFYTGKHGIEYKTLKLNPMFKTKYKSLGDKYIYKGIVREHQVSGHIRHYKSGKEVRVSSYKRGNPARGVIKKEYHITTGDNDETAPQ